MRDRVEYITENRHEFIEDFSQHYDHWTDLYENRCSVDPAGVLQRMKRLPIYKRVARDVRNVADSEPMVLGHTLYYLAQFHAVADLVRRRAARQQAHL